MNMTTTSAPVTQTKAKITTPGSLQIKHSLTTPEARDAYDLYRPLDKSGMSNLVNMIITKGGDYAHEDINQLSKTFFNKSTERGYSIPLDDFINDSDEKAAIIGEFSHKVDEIMAKNLPRQEQANQLNVLGSAYSSKLSKSNIEHMLSKGSTAAAMASIGARGNAMQLNQATGSGLLATNVQGNPIPVVLSNSYAEGLSAGQMLSASYGGRSSTVLAQLSTALPGALSKKILPALFHEVVTIPDCGTSNGIPIPISDTHSCIGRYEAKTNRLIDSALLKELQLSGKKAVLSRSPLTCSAKDGLCQKCFGLGPDGKLPSIGRNLGVIAGQSISEVLTQAMLSTKHQGGVTGARRNAYEQVNGVLTNSNNFIDQATIAESNGPVSSINQTSLKDWEVTVGNKTHFVPNTQSVIVKEGDSVRVGDPISTGVINPRQLVDLKGAGAGRKSLAASLREVYNHHAKLDPRHFDLVARNMIKHVEVTDPGESGFMPGDKIEVGTLGDYLSKHSIEIPLESSTGHTVAKPVLDLTPGTILTKNHIDDLKEYGIKNVSVSNSGLKTKALVPGLQSLKLLDKNWISKLGFNQLHKTIMEAGALGQESAIHSSDPISAYIMGNEFGEGSAKNVAHY